MQCARRPQVGSRFMDHILNLLDSNNDYIHNAGKPKKKCFNVMKAVAGVIVVQEEDNDGVVEEVVLSVDVVVIIDQMEQAGEYLLDQIGVDCYVYVRLGNGCPLRLVPCEDLLIFWYYLKWVALQPWAHCLRCIRVWRSGCLILRG